MSKDWLGNSSIRFTNIRKKDSEKDFEGCGEDFYATHYDSTRLILNSFEIPKGSKFWEPACGKGHICKVLEEFRFDYYASDIKNRGFPKTEIIDFLKLRSNPYPDVDYIITNPPYKYSDLFVEQFYDLNKLKDRQMTLIMFLKLTFLEGKKRFEMFKKYPPSRIYVHSSRQGCSPGGETEFSNTGTVAYAWYIWNYPNSLSPPQLFWLQPNS